MRFSLVFPQFTQSPDGLLFDPNDQILDPAHDDDLAVVAGVPGPEGKDSKTPADKDALKVSDDGNIAEHNGVRYVRQEALHQERERNRQYADTLARLEPLMPEFTEFLNQRNARQNSTVDRARGQKDNDSDYTADELEGFAITRGYYAADGTTPDTARAQKELDIISGISRRQTRREIEPVARTTRSESARLNRERAATGRFVDGQPVADAKYLDAAASALGDDLMADPEVSRLATIVAAGLEYLDHRKNGTLPGRRAGSGGRREPMMVERGGSRFDNDPGEMSNLDLAAARARGKSPEE